MFCLVFFSYVSGFISATAVSDLTVLWRSINKKQLNFNTKCCFASSLVFSQMPVPGAFHGVMPRLFLKRAEMFCRRTAAIYIKTICYHGDIHPSSLRYFWNRMYLCTYTLNPELNTNRQYITQLYGFYWYYWSLFKFRNLTCEHKKVKSCTFTYQGLFKVTWSATIQWVNMKGLKYPHDVWNLARL